MKGVKEEKKTLWDRFTSWLVKIWNRFTSLFSSNKSKVTVVESSDVIMPTEGKGMEAAQQVTTEPNMETPPHQPECEVLTQPQGKGDGPAIPATEMPQQQPEGATPEMAEEAKKGESEKVGNNGNPNPAQTITDSSAKGAPRQEKPLVPKKTAVTKEKPLVPKKHVSADGRKKPKLVFIKVDGSQLTLVVHKDRKSFDYSNIGQESGHRTYVKIGGEAYCVIVNPLFSTVGENQSFLVNSVKLQDADESEVTRNFYQMKGKLGLDEKTTKVTITEISKAPFKVKAPEVKSPDQANAVKSNSEAPKSVNPPATPEMAKPEKVGNNGSPNPEETDAKGNPQKKTPPVVPKKPKLGFIKVDGSYLKLVVRKDCKSFDKSNVAQNEGDKVYVTIGKKAYCVIVNPFSTFVGGDKSFIVNSVKFQGESKVSSNPHQMKDKLGLNDARTSVEVTRISDKPFPEVESPDQANSAKPDGETPTAFLETVDLKVQQQVADNGQSVPKAGNSRS